jgi:hypothetical protein
MNAAAVDGPAAWTAAAISNGVVQAAMMDIAAFLDPDFPPQELLKATHEGWRLSNALIFRDCRVSVFGTTSLTEVSDELLALMKDRSRESLCLCVLPLPRLSIWSANSLWSEETASSLIPIYPADVEALANSELSLERLIEYKLYRRLVLGRPDSETQSVGRLIKDFQEDAGESPWAPREIQDAVLAREDPDTWIENPRTHNIDAHISRQRGVLLVGYSSSGKTVLALQAGLRKAEAGWRSLYINLAEVAGPPIGITEDVLFGPAPHLAATTVDGAEETKHKPCLLVADDLQSNPALARLLLATSATAQRIRLQNWTVLLAISWKDFAREAVRWFENAALEAVQSRVIRNALFTEYGRDLPTSFLKRLEVDLGTDLYMLKHALVISKKDGSVPSPERLAEELWRTKVTEQGIPDEDARRVVLIAGSVGRFDIAVPRAFLSRASGVAAEDIEALVEARLLRRQADKLTLGHLSLSELLSDWLAACDVWSLLPEPDRPTGVAAVVLNYLRAIEPSQMIGALRGLIGRAGFKDRESIGRRAAALVQTWDAFDSVVERMEAQQELDPTWGTTPSSAMFAIHIFSELGRFDLANPSLEFIRSHWTAQGGHLDIQTQGLETTNDFELIRETLLREDIRRNDELPDGWERAAEIDITRFHKAWLSGLILGSEAAAPKPRLPLQHLASLVEKEALGNGPFYPARVPWCSARVLLGLAACGKQIDTSSEVKKCVEWLLADRTDGGARDGSCWLSGTGEWNSTIETTALVLLALTAAGVDSDDPHILMGRSYLLSVQDEWEGLDGTTALEALLSAGEDWDALSDDAARLSQWAREKSVWQAATLSATDALAQTCTVAQSASHLIRIAWTAIQRDLPELLDSLDLPDERRRSSAAVDTSTSQLLTHPTHDENRRRLIVEKLEKLQRLVLSDYRVVQSYSRFDDRARHVLRDWSQRIKAPLLEKTRGRENFLIWAPPGSGKSFFIDQIAESLGLSRGPESFLEIILPKQSQTTLSSKLQAFQKAGGDGPSLCLVDEIDAKQGETWPYDELFTHLDLNVNTDRRVVFVLIGSTGTGIERLTQNIESRTKGKDLLDRVPAANRFEIPPPEPEDLAVIFASQLFREIDEHLDASGATIGLHHVERFALYYLLANEQLSTPRQIRELARAAIHKLERGDDRLKYDHLFAPGDRRNQTFWASHAEAAERLAGTFTQVSR